MNDRKTADPVDAPPASVSAGWPFPTDRNWTVAVALLILVFLKPLYALLQLSLSNDLYSHALLIPVVSAFFAWRAREPVAAGPGRATGLAVATGVAGLAVLATYWSLKYAGTAIPQIDGIAFAMLAFVLFHTSISAWFLSKATLRIFAFPLAFLLLLVPMPTAVEASIETVLQHGSAEVAYVIFSIVGTPLFREDLVFNLPGISLQVAPECSGIRSSLALFVTSIVAGQLYLQSGWKRVLLAAAVLPLALIRNGFRVFTIGELCVRIGPDMINSYIHHHGGPIFFALSLLPFGALLFALVRSERRRPPSSAVVSTLVRS